MLFVNYLFLLKVKYGIKLCPPFILVFIYFLIVQN